MEDTRIGPRFVAACSVTLLSLASGTLTGWASPVVPRLRNAGSRRPLNPAQETWATSLVHAGHVAAALPAAALADAAGRRGALALAAAPFLASWVLAALAAYLADPAAALSASGDKDGGWPVLLPLIYAARILGGLGVGLVYTVSAMYLGETAPDRVRGAVSTLAQLAANAGVLAEYCAAPYVSPVLLSALSTAPLLVFLGAFAFAPESHYYLLMKGDHDGARTALGHLRGSAPAWEVDRELKQAAGAVEAAGSRGGLLRGLRALLSAPCSQRALCVCLGVYTAALLSGHAVVLSYAMLIFEESEATTHPAGSVMVLGGVQIAVSLASSLLVDVAGRRPLLLSSCAGCAVALAAEGAYFAARRSSRAHMHWLPLTALTLFLVAYSFGLGSVPAALLSELFPTDVKAVATAFLSMYHALMTFFSVKLMMVVEYELYIMFWTCAAFCVAGFFFVLFFVPETKGKSLLDVHQELQYGFGDREKERQRLIKNGK